MIFQVEDNNEHVISVKFEHEEVLDALEYWIKNKAKNYNWIPMNVAADRIEVVTGPEPIELRFVYERYTKGVAADTRIIDAQEAAAKDRKPI